MQPGTEFKSLQTFTVREKDGTGKIEIKEGEVGTFVRYETIQAGGGIRCMVVQFGKTEVFIPEEEGENYIAE